MRKTYWRVVRLSIVAYGLGKNRHGSGESAGGVEGGAAGTGAGGVHGSGLGAGVEVGARTRGTSTSLSPSVQRPPLAASTAIPTPQKMGRIQIRFPNAQPLMLFVMVTLRSR